MQKFFIVIFQFGCLILTGCGVNEPETKIFENNCIDNWDKSCFLTIKNNGTTPAIFTIKIGESFFLNEKEIASEIYKGQADSVSKEKMAWEYVMHNIHYCIPYSNKRWQHHPILLFNSLGNGQCDDMASVLAFLWKDQGFKSRVWSLEGHVVPEVFINGKWQMYDPSFGVYYLNDNNQVASVEELVSDTSLIRRNARFTENTGYISRLIASSEFLANIYFSKKDNHVNNWYDYKIDTIDLNFHLPEGSTFSYSIEKSNLEKKTGRMILSDYSFGTIEIPNNKCKVKAPLILYDIRGKGEVILNNKQFTIGSEELTNYIQQSENFIHEVVFPGNHSDVLINYLINKRQLKNLSDQIILSGFHLNQVEVEYAMKDLPVTEIKINLDSVINHYYKIYYSNKNKIEKLFDKQDSADTFIVVKNIIREIIMSDTTLSKEEKDTKFNHLSNQIDLITTNLNKQEAYLLINKIYYSPQTLIIFMACAENYFGDEYLSLLVRPKS